MKSINNGIVLLLFSLLLMIPDLLFAEEVKDTTEIEEVSNRGGLFKKSIGYRTMRSGQDYDRKESYTILEQGVSSLAFRINFGGGDTDNDWLGSSIKIENRKKFNIGFGLSGNYFFKANTSAGLRVGYNYKHNELHLNGKIFEMAMDARDYDTRKASESIFGTLFIRNYIPLGQAQRFYFINETNLYYNYTHSLARDVYDNGKDIKKIERNINNVGIGLTVGLMYFLSKGFAFEFSISPLVAYFENT